MDRIENNANPVEGMMWNSPNGNNPNYPMQPQAVSPAETGPGGPQGMMPIAGAEAPTTTSPAHTEQPVVSPTMENTQVHIQPVVVPHIHPSHTNYVNHTHIINEHYFPHTESCINTMSCEDIMCGAMPPCMPGMAGPMGMGPMMPGGPMGPGPQAVSPASTGPMGPYGK